jgi:hypothetical protein
MLALILLYHYLHMMVDTGYLNSYLYSTQVSSDASIWSVEVIYVSCL